MNIGEKYLITCNNWFFAPDGQNYRAVWGTVHSVVDSTTALGIKTNSHSSNWYVVIGDLVVAGCQVFYAIRSDEVSFDPPIYEVDYQGVVQNQNAPLTRIYNADKSGNVPQTL
jgi:hypothetical protein